MDPRPPGPPDALIDAVTGCACTAENRPWCARCECLIQIALARDVWHYERERSWWQTRADRQAVEVHRLRRREGWKAMGNMLLSWLMQTAMWTYYAFWALPRFTYLRLTRQIPHLPPTPLGTRLPVHLRVRSWCTVCERTLAEGAVRCPDHPEAEVMIVLRDEESP